LFLFALATVLFGTAVHVLYYFPRTVDDMYIFLRYAENWAAGEGLVYNHGAPVEGFSSPLWVALLTIGELAGLGGVTFAKLLALIALVALQVGLYQFSREALGLSPTGALVAPAFTAANSYVISWAMWGLETPAFLALMVWSALLLRRHVTGPSRRRLLGFWLVGSAFALSRPEAPFFLGLIGLAVVLEPLRWGAMIGRLRAAVVPSLAVVSVFGAYLGFRLAYFGHWLPHTYYAKQGHELDLENLISLWDQGASEAEIFFLVGGGILAIGVGLASRTAVPFFITLGTLVFVAKVQLDWMPNQRHFLPLWVFLPLAYACVIDAAVAWAGSRRAGPLSVVSISLACALLYLVATAADHLGAIDARYSNEDYGLRGSEEWILPKRLEALRDTYLCLRHEPPPHVEGMGPYHMGMISQLYRLLEVDGRPLEDSWYIGRDIGRVGFLAPIQIFDTDGLFTPEVVSSPEWLADESVSSELIQEAFDRRVILTELMNAWNLAAILNRSISSEYPPFIEHELDHRVHENRMLPTPVQIISRYERAVDQMPGLYYVMTLYGEAVGAALDRRLRVVREELQDNLEPRVLELPEGLRSRGVILDGVINLLGCTVTPEIVNRGEDLVVACYFQPRRRITRDYTIFLHMNWEGSDYRIHADHNPIANRLPTSEWRAGETIRDAQRVWIPMSAPPGRFRVSIGLFDGPHRAAVEPIGLADPTGRFVGPSVEVR
jgi:hypothetical protein